MAANARGTAAERVSMVFGMTTSVSTVAYLGLERAASMSRSA